MNDLAGLQQCLNNIMIEIDKICKANNLKYSLIGGSLIGAIRHNGFIPWDDDMDIGMPYNDYVKLIDVLKNTKHEWITFDYAFSKEYDEQFLKVYDSRTTLREGKKGRLKGVFVDVFPIVPMGNNMLTAKCNYYYDTLLKMARYNKTNNSKSSGIKMLLYRLIGAFNSANKLTKIIQKRRERLAQHDYKYVCDPDGSVKGIVEKELFSEYITHKFENSELMIIKEYDKYLKHVFGNYMELPPIEKRKPGHFELLDLEHSYLEVKEN